MQEAESPTPQGAFLFTEIQIFSTLPREGCFRSERRQGFLFDS